MKRYTKWWLPLAATALLGALVGCEEQGPIDRTQTLAVEKSVFSGSWYMTQTVIDVDYEAAASGTFPGDSASDFGGSFSGVPRIRWVIDENFLYAYRDYEMIPGGDGAPERTGTFLGEPVAAFRILSHFDIKRQYNPTTGEQWNIIEENAQDRRWFERDYMRVDWSTNLIPGYYGLVSNLYQVLGFFRREPAPLTVQQQSNFPDSWRPRFDRMPCASETDASCQPHERDLAGDYAQGELYHISFVNQEIVSPGDVPDPFTGQPVNWCLSVYNDSPECTATAVYVRTSFLKVSDRRQYVAENWNDTRWDRAGYFRLDVPTWDRSTGSPDDPAWFGTDFLNYAINRYNIWKNWYTTAADGTRTPIPYRDRQVRQIVWYTTPELPAHLVKPSLDLVGQWNEQLMETVRTLQGRPLPVYRRQACQTSDPGAYCYCGEGAPEYPDTDGDGVGDCAGRYDPFEPPAAARARLASGEPYDCYAEVPAGAEPNVDDPSVARRLRDADYHGWFDARMVGSECVNVLRMNTCNRASIAAARAAGGDALDQLMNRCEERGDARFKFLSYVDQPGTPFLGVATLRGDPVTGETLFGDANIGGPALDGFRTMALNMYDLMKGNFTDQEFFTGEDVRGYFESLNQVQLPNPPRIDFNLAVREAGMTGSPLPPMAEQIRARMDHFVSNRAMALAGAEGRRNIYSDRLARLRGTELEARLTSNYETLAMAGIAKLPPGYSPSTVPQGVLDRASPFRVTAPEMLDRFEAIERVAGRLNFHMPTEYDDDSVAFFVQTHLSWPRARVEIELNRLLYRQTQVHEMGHCMGLRHDFGGSADVHNYADDYYYIDERIPLPSPSAFDRDGTPGLSATEQRAFDTAYRTAKRDRELAGIDGWMISSIMDYSANWYQRLQPSGRYDHHAIRLGYGDIVEVQDNSAGRPRAEVKPINTPRVLMKWYQGGETCDVDADCPFASSGRRASELLPGNTEAGLTQRCVPSPRGGTRMCSSFDADLQAIATGPSPRWIPVEYRFCSDERAAGGSTTPGTIGWCNRFDEGDSYREIVRNTVESYERMYLFSNFRRYRRGFNIGGYLFDQLIGRRFVILQNIYQNLIYEYISNPAFRSDTGPFGFDDEFMATVDILNFYARVLGQPDIGGYTWNARWKWFQRASVDCQRSGTQLNVCLGKGRYFGSVYQGGLSGIERVERIGTFYDKLFTIQLMTLRGYQPRYTRDVPFYTNFYDLFPNEVQQIWNGMIRNTPQEYMPRVICDPARFPNCGDAPIQYLDFYRGDCTSGDPRTCRPDPVEETYAALPVINGGGSILLQIYAAIFGLTEFPVFFDTTFANQLFVCIEGQGFCHRPNAGDVEGRDYVRYVSRRYGRSYLAWNVQSSNSSVEQSSIGFDMVKEARDSDFILAMLVKTREGTALTVDERSRLDSLGYTIPTTAAEVGREIDRLDDRVRELESFFGQLVQLSSEIGISQYLRY